MALIAGGLSQIDGPNILGILPYCSVGGEPSRAGYIHDALAPPTRWLHPSRSDISLRFGVGVEIGRHHERIPMANLIHEMAIASRVVWRKSSLPDRIQYS